MRALMIHFASQHSLFFFILMQYILKAEAINCHSNYVTKNCFCLSFRVVFLLLWFCLIN